MISLCPNLCLLEVITCLDPAFLRARLRRARRTLAIARTYLSEVAVSIGTGGACSLMQNRRENWKMGITRMGAEHSLRRWPFSFPVF